jgi:putative hydrolase of the HAD superfamily
VLSRRQYYYDDFGEITPFAHMMQRKTGMIPENVKAIFFDAVGTLIHPEPAAAAVYWEVGRRHGTRYDLDQIAKRFTAAFAKEEEIDRENGWRTSEEREYRRWQQIVGTVLDDVADPRACFLELYEHFSRPTAWRLEPEAPAIFRELNKRGYLLGMASNYDRRLRSVVAGLPLGQLQHLVISSEVGWRKPARGFYSAMCAAAGLPAAQVLYIGDDPDNDYQGAINAGLQAVLLDRALRHTEFNGPRLQRLSQIVD